MSLFWEISLLTIGAAIYFNIGWFMGAYYYENVLDKRSDKLSRIGRIAAGAGYFLAELEYTTQKDLKMLWEIRCSIVWPVIILVVIISWFIYAIWTILKFIVLGIYLLFRLVFAGGISRLIWPRLAGTKACN